MVVSSPACSSLGSDRASERSFFTGRRVYSPCLCIIAQTSQIIFRHIVFSHQNIYKFGEIALEYLPLCLSTVRKKYLGFRSYSESALIARSGTNPPVSSRALRGTAPWLDIDGSHPRLDSFSIESRIFGTSPVQPRSPPV